MSGSAQVASPFRRDQSISAGVSRAERERRIVGRLNDGHSVAEIAAGEGLTRGRTRAPWRRFSGMKAGSEGGGQNSFFLSLSAVTL
jgi:hypothetical protein